MARLSVTLLGGFRARLDDDRALALPIKKAQALLAYLAVPPGSDPPARQAGQPPLGRHAGVAGPRGAAPGAVHAAQALGDTSALRLEGETVALDPAVVGVDVHEFEQCVTGPSPAAPGEGCRPLPGRSPRRARATGAALRGVADRRAPATARAGPGSAREAPRSAARTRARSEPAVQTALRLLSPRPATGAGAPDADAALRRARSSRGRAPPVPALRGRAPARAARRTGSRDEDALSGDPAAKR